MPVSPGKFIEGDVVKYSGELYFFVSYISQPNICVICAVHKIDIFGTDKDRMKCLAINSIKVNECNLELNTSGRL